MDAHGPGPGAAAGASKLTRTPSSLLRSPTVRNCSSFHAVLLEDDPEPDHKKSHAVAAQNTKSLLHTHNLRPAAAAHPLILLTLPLALLPPTPIQRPLRRNQLLPPPPPTPPPSATAPQPHIVGPNPFRPFFIALFVCPTPLAGSRSCKRLPGDLEAEGGKAANADARCCK
jgi:hypothetical protein